MRWAQRPWLVWLIALVLTGSVAGAWAGPAAAHRGPSARGVTVAPALPTARRQQSSRPTIRAIDFLSAQVGWIVVGLTPSLSSRARLYRTTDGGRRWTLMAAGPPIGRFRGAPKPWMISCLPRLGWGGRS